MIELENQGLWKQTPLSVPFDAHWTNLWYALVMKGIASFSSSLMEESRWKIRLSFDFHVHYFVFWYSCLFPSLSCPYQYVLLLIELLLIRCCLLCQFLTVLQEEMKSRDQLLEDAYKKFRKASVDACDQAAIEAKNAKVWYPKLRESTRNKT